MQQPVVHATRRDVWRLVAHLASVGLADDLTQETYLRAVPSLAPLAARSSARTWLLSIARPAPSDPASPAPATYTTR